jgi:hypothetical protein
MTKQVQRRRGTSTQHTSFTGAEGEISVNTTNKSIHVHDGTTAGGVEAARADLANVSDTSLNNALSGNTLASLTITSADINGGTIDGTTIGGTSPAAVTTTSLVATTADINGGTVDGAVIGGSSAAAITGTTITATGDVTIADKIIHAGDTNTAIRFPAADTVTVETSGAERLRVTSGGLVGLGTASPGARLEVEGETRIYPSSGAANLRFGSGGAEKGKLAVDASSNMAFETAGTERMRIDASGNLGLGVTPSAWGNRKAIQNGGGSDQIAHFNGAGLVTVFGNNYYWDGGSNRYVINGRAHIYAQENNGSHAWFTAPSGTAGNAITFTQAMTLDASGNLGIGTTSIPSGRRLAVSGGSVRLDSDYQIEWGGSTAGLYGNGANNTLHFFTNTTERARIDASGNLLVGTTSVSPATSNVTGVSIRPGGFMSELTGEGGPALGVNRKVNDGDLVRFHQDGTQEGSISVSGTTVSYNGGHLSRWAQFPDNSRPELLKGTVMSNLDQMSQWGDEDNEQLNCVQVSTVEGEANVAGVFVAWDSTDDGYNDILLAMTGDMVIRIGAGVTVARGDLLMSAGDGTAKPQGDDIVRSKTIAKVTSTHVSHTYADGSYAVPCVLMAC